MFFLSDHQSIFELTIIDQIWLMQGIIVFQQPCDHDTDNIGVCAETLAQFLTTLCVMLGDVAALPGYRVRVLEAVDLEPKCCRWAQGHN